MNAITIDQVKAIYAAYGVTMSEEDFADITKHCNRNHLWNFTHWEEHPIIKRTPKEYAMRWAEEIAKFREIDKLRSVYSY
ncbi:hypothetical protein ACNFJN_08880 [Xenorhabdus budapestensis]|uniref:hypothetical protein n=1 Tax=Xenorhabdus budapestensis TaxID=290110 RepID=UPI003A849077